MIQNAYRGRGGGNQYYKKRSNGNRNQQNKMMQQKNVQDQNNDNEIDDEEDSLDDYVYDDRLKKKKQTKSDFETINIPTLNLNLRIKKRKNYRVNLNLLKNQKKSDESGEEEKLVSLNGAQAETPASNNNQQGEKDQEEEEYVLEIPRNSRPNSVVDVIPLKDLARSSEAQHLLKTIFNENYDPGYSSYNREDSNYKKELYGDDGYSKSYSNGYRNYFTEKYNVKFCDFFLNYLR